MVLHFPNYSKGMLLSEWEWGGGDPHGSFPLAEETLAIIGRDCPQDKPPMYYHTFVNHIWNVFNSVCRDLSELRHLVSYWSGV